MEFHWWYIPIWLVLVFATSYLWTAAKYIARNDYTKGKKK